MGDSSNPYASAREPNRAPVVRIISWGRTAINFAVLAAVIGIFWSFLPFPSSMWIGAVVYLCYSLGSGRILAAAHRRGMRLLRQGCYHESILCFEESYRFFSEYSWLDRFRAITMLSPSAMSYREMALCNMAFGYAQLGQGRKAEELYSAVLSEYPSNPLARTALQLIESGKRIAADNT